MRLRLELGEREGMLIVPMPEHGAGADSKALGRLSKRVGDVFTRFASILEDGVIDERDKKAAPQAIIDLDALISVAHEMRTALVKKALGGDEVSTVVSLRNRRK